MDKKKAVNRLIDMMEKLPNAEVSDMAYILIDIINEMPDEKSDRISDPYAKSRAGADAAMSDAIAYARGLSADVRREELFKAFHELSVIMDCQEPTVMEQFCKWKEFDRRPRNFICRAIFENGVNVFSNLSFAQALEAAAKGKRVTHKTWSKRSYITQVGDHFVRASIDSDNVDDRIGITTEMLTGWIVLDR